MTEDENRQALELMLDLEQRGFVVLVRVNGKVAFVERHPRWIGVPVNEVLKAVHESYEQFPDIPESIV